MIRLDPHTENALAMDVRGLTVAYDGDPVLWDVDLAVAPGDLHAVVGPNGAGKSTLVKAALGLVPRIAGAVRVFGTTPRRAARRVAYVPQRSAVDWDFPTTVRDLVVMGTYGRLGWFRRPGTSERETACAALKRVGLHDLADRSLGELSGGQQQRAFLARAFAQEADLFVLDEPFAGVDSRTEAAIVALLHGLRDEGKSVLAVHHDLATVPRYFDQVTLLSRSVVASGPVERAFTEDAIRATYG